MSHNLSSRTKEGIAGMLGGLSSFGLNWGRLVRGQEGGEGREKAQHDTLSGGNKEARRSRHEKRKFG